jgi:HD-GYP domain-containing protein (c-di-GMP phosphodiesterase class II)
VKLPGGRYRGLRCRSRAVRDLLHRIERLNEIGVALSGEPDHTRLLETIVERARELTQADGGTLYLVHEDRTVTFEILRTASLGLALGGRTGEAIPFPALALDVDGQPNESMVVTHAVLRRKTVNIADAYDAQGFDFSGTRAFDQRMGYRTRSLLTVPMCDHENSVIGVLQLINAMDGDGDGVVPFEPADQRLVESLASQAAIALSNKRLLDQQRALFEAFVRLIAEAIDEKSPHTGAHCRRVPELTMMLADAADATRDGPLAGFSLAADDRYALWLAGWLHDCGKVTTPEHVMDKSTRLETVHDRIETVAARCAALASEIRATAAGDIRAAEACSDQGRAAAAASERDRALEALASDLAFLRRINPGGEFLSADDRARVERIGARRWTDMDGVSRPLLTDEEIENLLVERGTLNPAERRVIEQHVVATINMLESLPFPRHLRNVTEYAAGHHERVDGQGYPNGLTREQMSVPARAMAIADVFEALSAADRPYKPAKPLSECLRIMRAMRDDGHIDPDLFDVFIRQGVYWRYARAHLNPEQIDEVDTQALLDAAPGY